MIYTSISEQLHVTKATLDESPQLAGIITDAAAWRQEREGRQSWPIPCTEEIASKLIDSGATYLGYVSGKAVATLALHWDDRAIWGEQPDDAGYVHRLAVHPEHHGQGIGQSLLAWAGKQVLSEGRDFLRLDCTYSNTQLSAYYERLGFKYRGDLVFSDTYHAAKFERQASDS